MLLEEDEKARVKGLIINKFRGDKTILDPGVEMLEERGGVKVAGVVPYMHLSIEDEDSLSGQLDNHDVGVIDLAVIRFPRISNFTDFNVFERLEGVSVRYVSSVQELGQPDMIFLPGSKNTMGDLHWMRQNGLEAAVKKLAAHIPVWGICGGYQMLGRTISDPHGVENENSLREPLYPAHCEAISHEPDTIAVERILIGLDGYTVCSGVIDKRLNGESIIAVPLDEEDTIHIGYITHKKIHLSRLGTSYINALERYIASLEIGGKNKSAQGLS